MLVQNVTSGSISNSVWMISLSWSLRVPPLRADFVKCVGGDLIPQGTSDNIWRHVWLSQLGREILLACRDQGQLSILQCPGVLPTAKNYPAQNVNSAEARIPALEIHRRLWTVHTLHHCLWEVSPLDTASLQALSLCLLPGLAWIPSLLSATLD